MLPDGSHARNVFIALSTVFLCMDKGGEKKQDEKNKWTGDISGIANVNAANTTLTIPASAITITATYRIIVANGNVAASALKAWTQNGILYINGLTSGEPWSVYSLTGSLIYTGIATGSETTLALPGRGIYILKNSNFVAKIIN